MKGWFIGFIPAIQSTARPWMPPLPMPEMTTLLKYPPSLLALKMPLSEKVLLSAQYIKPLSICRSTLALMEKEAAKIKNANCDVKIIQE